MMDHDVCEYCDGTGKAEDPNAVDEVTSMRVCGNCGGTGRKRLQGDMTPVLDAVSVPFLVADQAEFHAAVMQDGALMDVHRDKFVEFLRTVPERFLPAAGEKKATVHLPRATIAQEAARDIDLYAIARQSGVVLLVAEEHRVDEHPWPTSYIDTLPPLRQPTPKEPERDEEEHTEIVARHDLDKDPDYEPPNRSGGRSDDEG
jgi:hypothetical protein